jgi:hypothetical protein
VGAGVRNHSSKCVNLVLGHARCPAFAFTEMDSCRHCGAVDRVNVDFRRTTRQIDRFGDICHKSTLGKNGRNAALEIAPVRPGLSFNHGCRIGQLLRPLKFCGQSGLHQFPFDVPFLRGGRK